MYLNEKNFDAMELPAGMVWEIKTDDYEHYTDGLRVIVLKKQLAELRRERELVEACGFRFLVGVRSKAHWSALTGADRSLNVFLMTWC